MRTPRLSIILPTFNRVESLRHAVAALLQMPPADVYEVIVVDNNCTDGTGEYLASLDNPRLRVVRESRQGLSYARNTGIDAARGDILAFTDDDVEVAPDWAATIVDALDRLTDVDGVGGRVLPTWPSRQPPWLTRDHWAPLALQDHGDQMRVFDRGLPIGLVGANLAVRRSVFERVGRFSANVQRVADAIGSTEDHDFLHRVYAAGGRMLYLPNLLVRARVQPARCARSYHRRWHAGHGRFHALMRLPEMERSRRAIAGVPAHLLRSAARDLVAWARYSATARWDRAFEAELRLRFFAGFTRARMGR